MTRLAGCGKTEQGSRSDSDPFTWGFGYVHGQNEFFRSLLEQALAIRDALLERQRGRQRFAGPYSPAGTVKIVVPGFECMLAFQPGQPDGLPFSLQVWPVSDEADPLQPHRKMLHNKVMHLAWSNSGAAELVSLRKPGTWVDALLAQLKSSEATVVYLTERADSPEQDRGPNN